MKIVYSYYVLDIVHEGHLLMMENAKAIAGKDGRLIVGILTDDAVMEKKNKPVIPFKQRMELAKSIKYVDAVVAQEEYSPIENVKKILPDVLMESASHDDSAIKVARDFMKSIDGKVIVLPYYPSNSSSDIKQTIIQKGESINVVIAAAGRSTCIFENGDETPKALMKIKGKSILERQVETLKQLNITDITVVRGFQKEQFTIPDVNYIDNNEYKDTGIFHSFYLASEKITGKTILLYGDVLFEKWIIEKIISGNADILVLIDRSWKSNYSTRTQQTISEAELVEVRDDLVCRLGRDIPSEVAYGEFIGISSISSRVVGKVNSIFQEYALRSQNKLVDDNYLLKDSITSLFNCLIDKGVKIVPVDISGGWIEIDTFEDFRKSWSIIN